MIDRRQALFGLGGFAATAAAVAGYGIAIEPMRAPVVRHYAPTPAQWPDALALRIGVLADLHACEPWMSAERVHAIALAVNALRPDVVLLLGDYSAGHRFVTGPVMPAVWAEALAALDPPLGTFAILGNHDWWHGPVPGLAGGPDTIRQALRDRRIPLLENAAVPLRKDGQTFWLAGLGDQMAHRSPNGGVYGVDDLHGTLRPIPAGDPILLLAHEPFIFPMVPRRVALTLSGHTHGGQVCLPIIGAPATPTRRYRYGHIVENGRHLIVSAGLGESGFPVRIGVPPEIVCIDMGVGTDGLTV